MAVIIATAADWTPDIFEWMAALGLFVFAPLALFRRCRPLAAMGFMIETPIFAILLWFSSAIVVYAHWGLPPVILSTLGLGVSTVILAAFVTLEYGPISDLLGLGVMVVVTIGAGVAAIALDG